MNKINNKFIKLILGKFRCILFLKIINFTIKIISENIEKKINCCFLLFLYIFLLQNEFRISYFSLIMFVILIFWDIYGLMMYCVGEDAVACGLNFLTIDILC